MKWIKKWKPISRQQIGFVVIAGLFIMIYRIFSGYNKRKRRIVNLRILFAWFEFIVPLENFSLIWRRHHYRWRAANFDLCSELMAIEQWGFFSVPHLLWHGSSIIMVIFEGPWHSHLLPSVWQWSCHYLFLRLGSVAAGNRIQPSAWGAKDLIHCATAAV